MEFPEEIVSVINTYAKPRMKFIHEYNQIVREIGMEWPAVKNKLATSDAEFVLYKFAYYAESVVMAREAETSVPVLAYDYTLVDYMKWLKAFRYYSMRMDVLNSRRQSLELFVNKQ